MMEMKGRGQANLWGSLVAQCIRGGHSGLCRCISFCHGAKEKQKPLLSPPRT